MNLLISIVFILWTFRIVTNLLSYIQLWWVKEYRFDRMLIHLGTQQGKKILIPSFRKPPVTVKTVLIFILSLITLAELFLLLPKPIFLTFIFVDLLTFPITGMWVSILSVPTFLHHNWLINNAVRKLRSHPPHWTVGITGSFGKTSIKEFLTTILSTKHHTLKTERSKNSPIGIAEVILAQPKMNYDIFVVEMGAYKIGEIRDMSKMVRPQVGIVTAINPQHQDLFGSIENTMRAKYELIESLPTDGIAIFNADDPLVLEMAQWANKAGRKVWLYSKTEQKMPNWADRMLFGTNITVSDRKIAFIIICGKEKYGIEIPILGIHQVSNILAAVLGAVAIGMSLKDAVAASGNIRPFTNTMVPMTGINGSLFINDTFNNNPDAAKAALDYLKIRKGKKYFIFQPMIELGQYTQSAHIEVGAYAAKICDEIILTNGNFYESFNKGVRSTNQQKEAKVLSPKNAVQLLMHKIQKGDTVLFKGKEAENILKLLQIQSY